MSHPGRGSKSHSKTRRHAVQLTAKFLEINLQRRTMKHSKRWRGGGIKEGEGHQRFMDTLAWSPHPVGGYQKSDGSKIQTQSPFLWREWMGSLEDTWLPFICSWLWPEPVHISALWQDSTSTSWQRPTHLTCARAQSKPRIKKTRRKTKRKEVSAPKKRPNT